MGAIANIVLADGQATPVNHTFEAVRVDSEGVARYADKVSGIPVGFSLISQSLKEPTKASPNYKAVFKFAVPTLEVTSPSTATGIQPAPTVAYTHYVTISATLPGRGTTANRKDVKAFVKNFVNSAQFTDTIENFGNIYG